MPQQITPRPVRTGEVVPALRLILGNDGQLADESQARDLMKFTAQRGINLADIWVTEVAGRVVWAALPVVNPGRTVLLFGTSATLLRGNSKAMDVGIEKVCQSYSQKDLQMAQVLLDPADQATVDAYSRCNFARMADLLYLQKNIRRTAPPGALPPEFKLLSYNENTHAGFASAILASYHESLDCPALNGLRSIQDIIAGHKASGPFDPADWFLLVRNDAPVAVLLLSKTHQGDGMELVYLGLSPSMRGYGLGNYLMQVAEARVYQHKLSKLTLAVDAINEPALKLYYRHGMQQIAIKTAMMRQFHPQQQCDPRTSTGLAASAVTASSPQPNHP